MPGTGLDSSIKGKRHGLCYSVAFEYYGNVTAFDSSGVIILIKTLMIQPLKESY